MTKFEYDKLGKEYGLWDRRNAYVSNMYSTLKDLVNLKYKDRSLLADALTKHHPVVVQHLLAKDYHHKSSKNKEWGYVNEYNDVVCLFVRDFEAFSFNRYGTDNWIWEQLDVKDSSVIFTKKDLPVFLKKLKQLKKVVLRELQKVEKEYFSVNVNELEKDPKTDLKNLLIWNCDSRTSSQIRDFLKKSGIEL